MRYRATEVLSALAKIRTLSYGQTTHCLTVDRVPSQTTDRTGLMSLDLPNVVFGRARANFAILIGYVLDDCICIPAEEEFDKTSASRDAVGHVHTDSQA
jgi:hypothetical protein